MEKKMLIYEMLKLIEKGIEPRFQDFEVTKDEFHDAAEQIAEDRLATNVNFSRGGQTNKILIAFMNGSTLTDQGKSFIKYRETGEM